MLKNVLIRMLARNISLVYYRVRTARRVLLPACPTVQKHALRSAFPARHAYESSHRRGEPMTNITGGFLRRGFRSPRAAILGCYGLTALSTAVVVFVALLGGFFLIPFVHASGADQQKPAAQIGIDQGHPWRPPFGLQRVGQPLTAVVTIASDQPRREYSLVGYRQGKEIVRSALTVTGKPPYTCRVSFDPWPTELVLMAKSRGVLTELARQPIESAAFEADAAARPERIIHPVDLGTILVPSDWLLLGRRSDGRRRCGGDLPQRRRAQMQAWLPGSNPRRRQGRQWAWRW